MALNGAGLPTTIRNPNLVDTNLVYDARNRLTSTTFNPGASQAVTAIEYDLAGDITKVTGKFWHTANVVGPTDFEDALFDLLAAAYWLAAD